VWVTIGVAIVTGGVIAIINGLAGYLIEPIREIERLLPDLGLAKETA
jgi:hypothetical protein